jgi:two-component system, cell cycle sensor histidine kinase and response regulator CckA
VESLVGKPSTVTRWDAVVIATSSLLMPDAVAAASRDQIVGATLINGSAVTVFAIILAVVVALLLYPGIKRRMQSAIDPNDARLVRASEIPGGPAAGTAIAASDADPDRRRRNEELLTSYVESDQLYAAVVRSANDAIITKTLDGKITGWNPGAERLFGYTAAEMIGKPIDIIIPPERRGDLHHILDRVGRGEYIDHYETVRITKDGRVLDVSLSISPVKSATGDIIGAAKIARDMTEQKKLRAQLLQAQKMEAVGLMAGGVAHDFNNLLLVMMIHAEMLRDDCKSSDPRLPGIVEIVHSIERARGLTRQLLAFSRKRPTEMSAINLGEIVAGVHSMLRRVLPANIEIVTLAGDDVWPVCADRGEIEQVLMNLAVNARDAMPNGGRFGIEIENRVIAGPDYDLPRGDYVAMRVSDSGIGIEAENLDKIFDPFFTTKERGRGTGLGLSLCYGIIAQTGGSLTVDSKPGLGTTFLVLLPRATREAREAAVPSEQPLAMAPGGRETILVVEDDQAVMRATVVTLKRSGYTVLTAANGDEARRLIYGRNEPLDLVLSDVVMPQLGGPELARHLAEVRPDLPVVFMTGYSDYPITSENGDNRIENRRAIMKPFHPRDLLSMIREVLDVRPERPGA